ncbi:SOS response-associated peptidase [Lignipirellula cremea]|uniref:Abasic site processing protein n=1 Tax=Lignipirellula cremea TaxID=2528010 RepID=A0A518E2N5_9BACT|nr:SOS response-associated peptidase [Lignipirellula cremea]QDU98345.1 Putative SOS response-associated peptidase YedK [Lignipirellula cremea]
MCGRYTLRTAPADVQQVFDLIDLPDFAPRYNIAPTQLAPVVRRDDHGDRRAAMLRWGLVPSWAKDSKGAARMINARAETVAAKPAYRAAFKRRRCLAIADGYLEWRTEQGEKQPYHFHQPDNGPLGLAALWESWQETEDSPPLESYSVITTDASDATRDVHDRMPVILPASAYDQWLDPATNPADLQSLLVPFAGRLVNDAVNKCVNNARHDAPDCLLKQKRLF